MPSQLLDEQTFLDFTIIILVFHNIKCSVYFFKHLLIKVEVMKLYFWTESQINKQTFIVECEKCNNTKKNEP